MSGELAKRKKYGMQTGIIGIILNVCLFAGKFIVGILSGAVSVIADAFNNLSDAGSSIISLIGFVMADKKPDKDHPFGHGRMEYIAGLFVSVLIIVMGFELGKTSIDKIIHLEEIKSDAITIVVLIIAIVVKFFMFVFNQYYGKKIDSETVKATAIDSISDCVATTVVLIAIIISKVYGYNIDGYAGLLVSAFIMFAGIRMIKETIDPLLGKQPDEQFVEAIRELVLEHKEIIGIHDLIVHDYGPGRRMISLHCEVPQDSNIVEIHDVIDACERRIYEEFNCEAVIHMDPVANNDEMTMNYRKQVEDIISEYNCKITIHDFRISQCNGDTRLLFDAVVPIDEKKDSNAIKKEIERLIADSCEGCHGIVNVDREYTELRW